MHYMWVMKKATALLLLAFCCAITFTTVDAERSVRIVKRKLSSSPTHIHLPKGPPNSYASRYGHGYGYGWRTANRNPHEKFDRNKKYFERRNKKFGPKNPNGSAQKNLTANRFQPGKYGPRPDNGKYHPRIDNGRRGYSKPRKEPYPFVRDPYFKNNQKRKVRPQRGNHLQRPKPPKYVTDLDDDDYYFPEEAVKADGQNGYETAFTRPKKKRKNPGTVEKILGRPETKYVKVGRNQNKKIRDGPSPSPYGTFVSRPFDADDDNDDDDEDNKDYDGDKDATEYMGHGTTKTKKKKTKKTKSSSKKRPKDEEDYPPYSHESEDASDRYKDSYGNGYDKSDRNSKKHTKKHSYDVKDEEEKNYGVSYGSVSNYNGYRVTPKPQDTTPFMPSYSQPWSQVVGTTVHPPPYSGNVNALQPQQFLQSGSSYQSPQPQYNYQNQQSQFNYQNQLNHFNYQHRDFGSVQTPPQVLTGSHSQQMNYYSPPDSYSNHGVYNSNNNNNNNASPSPQASTNYNAYSVSSNNAYSSYQQPSNVYSDSAATAQRPVYDSTQNYYSYNGNGYVKDQSLGYLDGQKYGNAFSLGQQNANLKTDDESEFLRKHQSLYNKGLSGVPIQGDGYRKESLKKDYDIGYGDFQFDDSS